MSLISFATCELSHVEKNNSIKSKGPEKWKIPYQITGFTLFAVGNESNDWFSILELSFWSSHNFLIVWQMAINNLHQAENNLECN